MLIALLVPGLGETVVRRPAVADQVASVVEAEQCFGRPMVAVGIDDVGRGPRADEAMQPGGQSTDPPASLVGPDPVGTADRLTDRLIDRSAASAGPQEDVGHAAARQGDAEQVAERPGDLAL